MGLIRYAGYDLRERNYVKLPPETSRAHTLFMHGHDTLAISLRLGCTEAEALRLVSIGRSRWLNKPSPYEGDRS
jgi:hypothetical protein